MGPIMLALQIVAADPLSDPPAVIDLLAPVRLLRCPEATGEDIVICGHRVGEEERLVLRADVADRLRIPRAETRLFGTVSGSVDVEAAQLPGGVQSNRLMVRLKTPF